MAQDSPDFEKQYKQYLELLPLTIALAGLPQSEHRLYTEEQLEARAITIRNAYKVAKNTTKEVLEGS